MYRLIHEHFVHKNQWLHLLSTRNDWRISLFLLLSSLRVSQSFHYHVCSWRKKKLRASMETLLLLLTKLPNARKCCLCASFCLSFVFSFSFLNMRSIETIGTTTAYFQSFNHSNLSKTTIQVTLSNQTYESFFLVVK